MDWQQAACVVLCQYPDPLARSEPLPLSEHEGFSGALLWRVATSADSFCLRAWPSAESSPERLRWIHHLMRHARSAGLTVVPAVLPTSTGLTCVAHGGRLWDVTIWMPGQANFRIDPRPEKIEEACGSLAALHAVWLTLAPRTGPSPAVERRWQTYRGWQELCATGWRPNLSAALDPLSDAANDAWNLVQRQLPRVPMLLAGWSERILPLQPCLGDIWYGNILFEGTTVSALLDYGSARIDHVTVDVARLLGSMAGNNQSLWQRGLAAYQTKRPLTTEEQQLAHVLDQTGAILGTANWLRWLYHDQRTWTNRAAVANRLTDLVQRLRSW